MIEEQSKSIYKHEVWIDKEGLTSLCYADERGDNFRKLLDEEGGGTVIHVIYAESHFEAMTLYYKFMGWGEYQTNFEIDKVPYSKLT